MTIPRHRSQAVAGSPPATGVSPVGADGAEPVRESAPVSRPPAGGIPHYRIETYDIVEQRWAAADDVLYPLHAYAEDAIVIMRQYGTGWDTAQYRIVRVQP